MLCYHALQNDAAHEKHHEGKKEVDFHVPVIGAQSGCCFLQDCVGKMVESWHVCCSVNINLWSSLCVWNVDGWHGQA